MLMIYKHYSSLWPYVLIIIIMNNRNKTVVANKGTVEFILYTAAVPNLGFAELVGTRISYKMQRDKLPVNKYLLKSTCMEIKCTVCANYVDNMNKA